MLRALVDTPTPFRRGGADNPPHAGAGGFYAEEDGAWTDVAGTLLLLTAEPRRGGAPPHTHTHTQHTPSLSLCLSLSLMSTRSHAR